MRVTPREQLELWIGRPELDAGLRAELESLREGAEADPDGPEAAETNDRFYRDLEFGTGGMRGVLGAGSNRMNVHTVRRITQGFADFINAGRAAGGAAPSVAIGYDNREKSDLFAFETACVLLANGIDVHIYPTLMPTPALSFAVRSLGCRAGVMITASHNTKEYNGYKVYDAEGEQSLPDESEAIAARISVLDMFDGVRSIAGLFGGSFSEKLAGAAAGGPYAPERGSARLKLISSETVDAYMAAVLALSMGRRDFSRLSLVYTPLNGTGNIPVRRALGEIALARVHVVPEQTEPDGGFPTCPYPNPEKREALALGLALCEKLREGGEPPDLLIATDPDCDRVGVAAFDGEGYRQLTGNETGVLLLDFICRMRIRNGTMPKAPVAVKTIVSSPMASVIAAAYGVEMLNVLTGFKFIGEQISLLEKKGEAGRYIFGFEESCGYMSGAHVRDKDAVNACVLIAELAAECKDAGLTVAGRLDELYRRHGFYESSLLEFAMEGETGMERLSRVMGRLRKGGADGVFSRPVAELSDYLSSRRLLARSGAEEAIGLPRSDVLEYVFDSGSSVIARPSGTEPKLKVYLAATGDTREAAAEETEGLRSEVRRIIDSIE
ncbi:MAG: phospho-sugar mutase [Clostridiales Family XIII bacterium]|jgi:phosphoglucomutase|nr:phospho-sugar mutase [Clostridiales Family XIII bacterium]